MLIVASLFLVAGAAASCTRSRFGCCLDGVTTSTNPEDVGCPAISPGQSDSTCSTYLQSLPAACSTRTNCRKITCLVQVLHVSMAVTISFHRCSQPLAMNVTVADTGNSFTWQRLVAGKTTVEVANADTVIEPSGDINVFAVALINNGPQIFSSGQVWASFALRTSLRNYQTGQLTLRDIIVVPYSRVPVEISDCSSGNTPSQDCGTTSSAVQHSQGGVCTGNNKCVWAASGSSVPVVCYTCPSGSCPSGTSASRLCGSNGVTYESDCHLRQDSCAHYTEIRVTQTGSCNGSSTPPNPIDHLPSSFGGLDDEDQAFLRDYVVSIKTSLIDALYTVSYIEIQLRTALEYNIVILDINSAAGSSNITFYAYHLHSEELVSVKADVLIKKVKNSFLTIGRLLRVEVTNAAQLSVPDSGNDTNLAVIVVPVVLCIVCVALLVVLGIWFLKRRQGGGGISGGTEDVSYLPQQDEVSIQKEKIDGAV